MNESDLYPYRYTGAPGEVGRHGKLAKGDIVWLDRKEQSYVSRNSQRDFARMTGEEAAKLARPDVAMTPEGTAATPEETRAISPGTKASVEADAEILKQEVADTAELLAEQHTQAELIELLKDRKLDGKKTEAKKILAERLAPSIVEENRAASAAADKPADKE